MNWIERKLARIAVARLLDKLEKAMKPMPKLVGALSLLASIAASVASIANLLPPKYAVIATTLATFLATLSHSLPGSGGTPSNP